MLVRLNQIQPDQSMFAILNLLSNIGDTSRYSARTGLPVFQRIMIRLYTNAFSLQI